MPTVVFAQEPSTESRSADCSADLEGIFVELLAGRLGDATKLRTGIGTDYIVERFVERACDEPAVAEWVPRMCAPWPDETDGSLLELRRRMIADLAALGARVVENTATGGSRDLQLRLAQAVAIGVLEGVSPDRLPALLVPTLAEARRCDELPSLPPLQGSVPAEFETVARILQAIAEQPEDPTAAVASILGGELDPTAQATLSQLRESYAEAKAAHSALSEYELDSWLVYARSMASTLGLTYGLVFDDDDITQLSLEENPSEP